MFSLLGRPPGLHISAIRWFLKQHPEIVTEGMTTSQINRQIIKLETSGTNLPYVAKLSSMTDSDGVPFVSSATAFVSHAWRYPFSKTVVDVMEQFASENQGTYFWFDLFTNDQNAVATKDFHWFSTTFRDSIRSIGQVLLVLSPWNDPLPLKRAWCLFEIFNSLTESEVKLTVKLPLTEVSGLASSIEKDENSLIQALSDIQAQKAEATSEDDKNMIFEVIQKSQGGFSHVNSQIKKALREWYVSNMRQLVKDHPSNIDLMISIAMTTRDLGFLDESLEINQSCLELVKTVGNDKERKNYEASVYHNMANIYMDKNQLDLAIQYYKLSLERTIELNGEDHPDVAASYSSIGLIYFNKGDYASALSNFKKALDISIRHFGKMHADVSGIYNNMALVYRETGEPNNALEYFNKALDIDLKLIGEKHPTVAARYNNIANVYKDMQELDTSLEYRNKSLAIRIEVLGEDHPFVAGCYNGIANIYHDKGDLDLALEYHEKSLEIRRNGLGENHPFVADSFNNMGNVLLTAGRYSEALDYMSKGLAIRLEVSGESHPNTAMSYSSIAKAHRKLGNLDKAEELNIKALNLRRQYLGENHVSCADSYNRLANIYMEKGGIDIALNYYQSSFKLLLKAYGENNKAVIAVQKKIDDLQFQMNVAG